ncbi:MAG TPA: DUF1573 domain-containing protein [Chitinophagaceae bacterium]|jgi:hypothetical protein|nr:DUF1573 domain-containing protein [Chitinophagaceae bacterium]
MKKALFCGIAVCLMFCGTAFGQTQTNAKDQATASATTKTQATKKSPFDGKIKFQKETVDFGTAKLNHPVTVQFEFTNVGQQPVIIQSAQPSCGCTTPSWTKEPVLPGKKGVVKAIYNSAVLGQVNKTVFVNFKGIPQTMELHLTGKIEK